MLGFADQHIAHRGLVEASRAGQGFLVEAPGFHAAANFARQLACHDFPRFSAVPTTELMIIPTDT